MLTGSMEAPRERHTATKRTDGKVLVAGGLGETGDLSTAELFANGIFTPAGNMKIQRSEHTATLLKNGEVLITGGNNQDGSVPVRTLSIGELFP